MVSEMTSDNSDSSKARAMRLLALVRERTEHSEPVVVSDLAAACELTAPETEAAWRYLKDHRLIDTFRLPLSAKINTRGIDLLEEAKNHGPPPPVENFANPAPKGATVRGYGRSDPAEGLDRAREVTKELERLKAFLPTLTDSELSAYSTKSLPIGTFLRSKGQTFSVLTEDMLANAFREEVERRKKEVDRLREDAGRNLKSRESGGPEVGDSKRKRWEFASSIAGIVAAIVAVLALIVELRSKHSESNDPKPAPPIARLMSCVDRSHVCSDPTVESEDVDLTFINSADSPVDVHLINEQGEVVSDNGSVIPKVKNWEVTTSRSHIWLISSAAGTCIGIIRAGEADSIVTIDKSVVSRSAPLPARLNDQIASVPANLAPTKVVLAAFNLDDRRGYFKEMSPWTFQSTNKYGRLAGCVSTEKYKTSQSYRKRCGDVAGLTPMFDVTLSVDGGGQAVLNSITAEVNKVTQRVEGSEGATVPEATIPLSAKYVIDLPAQQEGRDNYGTVRVAAIPPLLLSARQPARFQIAVRQHCVNECTAVLSFAFGLSIQESLTTEEIQFDFGHDIPDPCFVSTEDLVDRCVADWDRKAQQEEKKREAEDRAETTFDTKAGEVLKAAGISYTHAELWTLWKKGVKPEDAVEALNQARSSKELRQ